LIRSEFIDRGFSVVQQCAPQSSLL
jgi:hypothetical protein